MSDNSVTTTCSWMLPAQKRWCWIKKEEYDHRTFTHSYRWVGRVTNWVHWPGRPALKWRSRWSHWTWLWRGGCCLKLISIMENISQPLRELISFLKGSLQLHCDKEHYRKSFLPAVITLISLLCVGTGVHLNGTWSIRINFLLKNFVDCPSMLYIQSLTDIHHITY